jgi:ribosomal protein S18 acetylase RimI-like enzyme
MTVMVRPARTGDLPAMATLNEEVQRLHVAARPDQFVPTSSTAISQAMEKALGESSLRFWVAELDARVAGYAVVRVRSTEAGPYLEARLWWEIDQIGVAATLRERGVARALVETIAREAEGADISSLELTCWSFNAEARAAFEKLGFTPKTLRMERLVKTR